MTFMENPALNAFVLSFDAELRFAQVVISRRPGGFELRHVNDQSTLPEALRDLKVVELRQLAQSTKEGVFRPLKSAPNLADGWRCLIANAAELGEALNHLYPGAVADWFAVKNPDTAVITYRDYTGRQTGMYRITQLLSDEQVALVTQACCQRAFCLKQRHWNASGQEPDAPGSKSLIPCLEPCALLLEFARKAMRIEQQEKISVALAPDELASLTHALKQTINSGSGVEREGNFNSPANARRLALALAKLEPLLTKNDSESGE